MFRYKIYVFNVKNNKITSNEYDARHFEVNNFTLDIYPVDFSECLHIPLTTTMRFEINPYSHVLVPRITLDSIE